MYDVRIYLKVPQTYLNRYEITRDKTDTKVVAAICECYMVEVYMSLNM